MYLLATTLRSGCLALILLWVGAVQAMQMVDMSVWVGDTGTATIESVSAPEMQHAFKPLFQGLSAGYTYKVHWLKASLKPQLYPQGSYATLYLEAQPSYLDDLRFYLPRLNGGWQEFRHGDTLPFEQRLIAHRNFVQPVEFWSHEPITVFVRLQTTSSSMLVLRVGQDTDLLKTSNLEYAALAALIALLFTALLTNFSRSGFAWDALGWAYTLYLGAAVVHLLGVNGFVAEFLFPATPAIANHWQAVTNWLIGCLSLVVFGLSVKIYKAHRVLLWTYLMGFLVCLSFIGFVLAGQFTQGMKVLLPFYVLCLLVGFVRAVQLVLLRDTLALYILLALCAAIFAHVSATFALMGVLPGTYWLMFGYQIGVALMFLVLQLMFVRRAWQQQQAYQAMELASAEANAKLASEQQARATQRSFINMLTHELKTPLSVIRMVLGAQEPSDNMRQHATTAVQDIDQVIDRVALATKLEEGLQPFRTQRVDVGHLVQQVVAQCAVPERVQVQSPQSLEVMLDPLLFQTVLSNLLSNAIKYGAPSMPIQVKLTCNNHALTLEVSNATYSRHTSDTAQWFDKYFRAPTSHAQVGSGLGLTIVQDVLKLVGGHVQLQVSDTQVSMHIHWPLEALCKA